MPIFDENFSNNNWSVKKNARIQPKAIKMLALFHALIDGEIVKEKSAPKPPVVENKNNKRVDAAKKVNRLSTLVPEREARMYKKHISNPKDAIIPSVEVVFSFIKGV